MVPKQRASVNENAVVQMFGRIAHRYDLANDLISFGLHRWWKNKLVELAGVRVGSKALDLCCGTGDVAYRLKNAGATVIGVDLSLPMLELARARQRQRGDRTSNDNLLFIVGDAMALPFPDNSFEIATCAYGLRNTLDWKAVLSEVHRVLKNGGCFVLLDFGRPRWKGVQWVYFAYMRWIVPLIGGSVTGCPRAYRYLLESIHNFPTQKTIANELVKVGYRVETQIEIFGGIMWIIKAVAIKEENARSNF